MNFRTIYDAFDSKGNLLFSGTTQDLAEKLMCSSETLYNHINKNGEYLNIKFVKHSKADTKSNEKVYTTEDYLFEHLSIYGNTVLKENPTKYIDVLKKKGIEFTFIHKKDGRNDDDYYILEVVN